MSACYLGLHKELLGGMSRNCWMHINFKICTQIYGIFQR